MVISQVIAAVTYETNAIIAEDSIMIVNATEDTEVIVIAKEDMKMTVIAIAIMTETLTDAALFHSVTRPAVAKIINASHKFSKELKFNISKSECHVIICMAFFFVWYDKKIITYLQNQNIFRKGMKTDEKFNRTNSEIWGSRILMLSN